jgi:hypothetical protein
VRTIRHIIVWSRVSQYVASEFRDWTECKVALRMHHVYLVVGSIVSIGDNLPIDDGNFHFPVSDKLSLSLSFIYIYIIGIVYIGIGVGIGIVYTHI